LKFEPSKLKQICTLLLFFVFSVLAEASDLGAAHRNAGPRFLIAAFSFSIILFLMSIGALSMSLFYSILFPKAVSNGVRTLRLMPLRAFFAGFLCLCLYLIALSMLKHFSEPLRIALFVPIALAGSFHSVSGLSMVLALLGEKIAFNTASKYCSSSFMHILFAGIVFVAIGLLPVLGQIAQGVIMISGLGAFLLSIGHRETKS